MTRILRFVSVLGLAFVTHASTATAQDHDVSQSSSPRMQLTGDIGVSAVPAENLALAAASVQARFYSADGVGGLIRFGYEGLVFLNYGVIDVAATARYELPGGNWAGFGLSAALGLSALIRDSVYHFTGDDVALAVYGSAGIDVRLGSFLLGVDAIGRFQVWSDPLTTTQSTRPNGWGELGAVLRLGGEVLL